MILSKGVIQLKILSSSSDILHVVILWYDSISIKLLQNVFCITSPCIINVTLIIFYFSDKLEQLQQPQLFQSSHQEALRRLHRDPKSTPSSRRLDKTIIIRPIYIISDHSIISSIFKLVHWIILGMSDG